MEKTEAILINRMLHRETSLIVSWCAPEAGIFRTLARGALRPKSPFAGRLDLFVSAEVRFVRSRISDLHTLAEVQWIDARLRLRDNYGRVLAATYFARLIAQIAEREAPIPALYDLLKKALDFLTTRNPSTALVDRFEHRLALELGVAGEAEPSRAIESAFHRKLPVQRGQLLEWIKTAGATGAAKPAS